MGFWFDLYGKRSKDFIAGCVAGVEMYAVWKDGEQEVGIHRLPLAEVIHEIETDLTEVIK